MKIYRVSPITGQTNVMDLNITQDQYSDWQDGKLIQDTMPHLTPDEREFLLSGCTKEDWDTLFGDDDEKMDRIDNAVDYRLASIDDDDDTVF